MKTLRAILLALLFSLLFGLAIGTWIRLRMNRPERYFVAVPLLSVSGASSGGSLRPLDVRDAGAYVLEPGQHEQQVG